MNEQLRVITRKGQVTLPAAIRHSLNLKQGDKVAFRLEDGRVVLTRGESVAAATKGIFRRYADTPRTAEELREAAEQAIAEEVEERSR
jgi:AbrB family looped-hinge helix DNA binding protein